MKIYVRDWFWLCLVIAVFFTNAHNSYERGKQSGYTQGVLASEPFLNNNFYTWSGLRHIPYHTYHYKNGKLTHITPLNPKHETYYIGDDS